MSLFVRSEYRRQTKRINAAAALTVLVWMLLLSQATPAIADIQPANAAKPVHLVAPGFDRFYVDPKSDVLAGGQLLLGELNCTSCHQTKELSKQQLLPKAAPILDDVAARVKSQYLRAFLADPQQVKPGTQMPHLLGSLPKEEAAAQVEALVQFLSAGGTVADTLSDQVSAKRGENAFHKIGCVACHAPRRAGHPPVTVAVPLGDLASKYSATSLAAFLEDPLKTRPSARMPAMQLKKDEARDLANYFLQDVQTTPNIKFSSYEGTWQNLPDFAQLQPKAVGSVSGFDVEVAKKPSNFGIRFEAFLPVDKEGDYTFHVDSDDGSRLYVGAEVVVDHDGVHPRSSKNGKIHLREGVHPIMVDYFQGGGEAELAVEYEGPKLKRQSLDPALSLHREAVGKPVKPTFKTDPALVERGRQLFASTGCASCHQMKRDSKKIDSTLKAPKLADLKPAAGCLSLQTQKGIPNFSLSARQREALEAALAPLKLAALEPVKASDLPAKELLARTMSAFQCYACHQRDGVGGVDEPRDSFFQTTMKEMGDEGRLPPQLNGVGDKLNPEYFKRIFNTGGEDRPYVLTRMPRFGDGNVGHLTPALVELDRSKTEQPLPELTQPVYRVKSEGRYLVGSKALACIKCHDFAQYASTGIRAINLTKMTQRLRPDWFHRYLLDPQKYRPGTRMPAPWPNGQTFFRNVLDGDTHKQIAGVWTYLLDGTKAAIPTGLIAEPIELAPTKEPIIYRNFIDGAGSRAIGVGYPEKVNLAFDAENARLALVWHGSFIDASRHWTGRGAGFQPPSGDHVLPLSDGSPFAILENASAAWPTKPVREQGYQFGGYRLDAQRRPTFLYRFGSIQVEDRPEPVKHEKEVSLKRTLTLVSDKSQGTVWYRAAVGAKIEPRGDARYLIDDSVNLQIAKPQDGSVPEIRAAGAQSELLLPLRLTDGKATIALEYAW